MGNISINMNASPPIDKRELSNFQTRVATSLDKRTLALGIKTQPSSVSNQPMQRPAGQTRPATPPSSRGSVPQQASSPAPAGGKRRRPRLARKVRKGQKVTLQFNGPMLYARLGWDVAGPEVDIDVSAFLLGNNGKVLGDDWFVFYGQEHSPDGAVTFSNVSGADLEMVSVNTQRLQNDVAKIVFVLTINEALENHLNFSMVSDAYVRIMDAQKNEVVSFLMDEYYENVTSMMIGELYRYNGAWKFSAIGNGTKDDLAGLCARYGVSIDD